MHFGVPAERKWKRVIWGILVGLVGLAFLSFRREIIWLLGFPPAVNAQADVLQGLPFLVNVCFGSFFLVGFLWLVLVSFQALLPVTNFLQDPVQSLKEVYRTFWHLLFYLLRWHGPATFVKDGIENITLDDKRRTGIGVVVVDYNSAVVVEELNPPPGLVGVIERIKLFFLEALSIIDRKRVPDQKDVDRHFTLPLVSGAGLIFTRPRERVRGAVDLRRQFRMEHDVPCYTREGIELKSNMNVLFSIGYDPEILQVTYIGEKRCENLRVVQLEKRNGNQWLVKDISENPEELEDPDRDEIQGFFEGVLRHEQKLYEFSELPDTDVQKYNKERVFAAVFAQARSINREIIPWTDLPARVAAGMYREMMAEINYDQLYDVKEQEPAFPLQQHKNRLRIRMRNNGILSYRLVFARNGRDLVKNRVYNEADLVVSDVQTLQNPKTLRDRGIRILFAGFGDLIPVNQLVYQQRLDSWRAKWERDEDLALAAMDLRAMRQRSQAHAEAQRDLWFSLSRLLEENPLMDEAVALRVLQALESAAADPRTRSLLPEETISLMQRLHHVLLPGDFVPTNPPPPPSGGAAASTPSDGAGGTGGTP